MKSILFETADDFLRVVRPFLEKQPAANQLPLWNATRLPATEPQADVLLAAVSSNDSPILVAIKVPSRPLVLSYSELGSTDIEKAARALAKLLATKALPSVMGPRDAAHAFAAAYCNCRGITWRLFEELGIYQLTKATPPNHVPGGLRAAAPSDMQSLVNLREGLCVFIQRPKPREEILNDITEEIEAGILFLWEHETPVSTAVLRRPLGKGIAIGGVYTPPELRRKGYASACVAALSQRMLDRGYEYCSLYTNLANPTSNHIYQTIGYEPICEVVEIKFDHPAAV